MGSQRTVLVPSPKRTARFSFFSTVSGRFSGEAICKYREQENFEDMDFLLLEMTVGGLDLSFPISLKIRRR